jgi:hypothetical protein
MNMLRGLLTRILILLILAACVPIHAEVSVRTDRDGDYIATQVFYVGLAGAERKIWSPRGRGVRKADVLNASGDATGDLWPAICESPNPPYYPVVVWSRFSGVDYDLAWSHWTGDSWKDVAWVFMRIEPGDDLDPDLVIDSTGRPYVVWWRDSASGGQVFASTLLVSRWTEPFLLSELLVDSRYPTIELDAEDDLIVTYETKDGPVTQILAFTFPDTITDDINPQIQIDIDVHHVSERTN